MKSVLLGCIAVLMTGAATAAPPSSLVAHKPAHLFITGAPAGSKTLYDQNKDSSGLGVFSQSFDGSQAADDFAIPSGHSWRIREVDVTGIYFDGSGPANFENVAFYKDSGGLPGDLVLSCPDQNGLDNGFGSFAIRLSKTCKAKLGGAKTYWVSVQANIDFGEGGEWAWQTSSDTTGNQAAWQEPGSDCPTWGHLKDCLGIDGGLMFALKGRDIQR